MVKSSLLGSFLATAFLGASVLIACSAASRDPLPEGASSSGGNGEGGASSSGQVGPIGSDEDGGVDASGPVGETRDPVDCEEAKTSKSYVGCDYWPTVVPNAVWSIFDYAVVVANTGAKDAVVTVTGPNAVSKQVNVPTGELRKVYLPWVPALKGPDVDACGAPTALKESVVQSGGAYHLVSSSPVIVYQFSALQYKGEGAGGPDGNPKDWSACPGKTCGDGPVPCFSYSNDASLLLPSTAMTSNYRVTSFKGRAPAGLPPLFSIPGVASALTVTATAPSTQVTLTLSSTATVVATGSGGGNIPATASGKVNITLANPGDVAMFVSGEGKDFSGSLVQSDKPVQVISSIPCVNIPDGSAACDHIEETVLPAETLGKHYVVVNPTGPKGTPVGQWVRFVGNQDGTTLTYKPVKPSKCPGSLNAGQTVDCEVLDVSFEVTGDKEFGVSTFLLGATVYKDTKGDPSQTNVAGVEQFRTKYVFLAPDDYPVLYADITAEEDAAIELDGKPLGGQWTKVASGPYGVLRADLTKSGQAGAHTLTAKKPVGVQVIGFGDNTSFQYPAGLNLSLIAPPPPPPK